MKSIILLAIIGAVVYFFVLKKTTGVAVSHVVPPNPNNNPAGGNSAEVATIITAGVSILGDITKAFTDSGSDDTESDDTSVNTI